MKDGWIGVDLDGTLAEYHGWKGIQHIGAPIAPMVNRVKRWLAEGFEVRVFTARVGSPSEEYPEAITAIKQWCEKYIGRQLPVTNVKDFGMIELWDDRAVQINHNRGTRADGKDHLNFLERA